MKGFIEEFKKFIMRGNVVDLAIGIIIGSAFNKIVSSLVEDIIMPIIGMIIGKVEFSDLKIVLEKATESTEEVAIRYGLFIQNIVDFLIIGLSVFIVVKAINKFRKKQEQKPAPPEPSQQEKLLTEIRDILKAGQNN